MIQFTKGNLLQTNTQALVNTVNTVGVMGKGIALLFKEKFPENFKLYAAAVKNNLVNTGKMFVTTLNRTDDIKFIINFPTKTEWYKASSYHYIEEGLQDLVRVIHDKQIKSIAIPPLGCGNGKLKWEKVKPLMEKYLSPLKDVDIIIYQPDAAVKEILQQQDQKKEVGLTAPRAMLLYSLFYYEATGEISSLFSANKLSYFIQRFGEKQMKINFIAHHYGPYSQQVDYLMYALNGKYLKGLEQKQAKAFEPLELNYKKFDEVKNFVTNKLTSEQKQRLSLLQRFITGFESSMALEVLASVDYVLRENPEFNNKQVLDKLHQWTNRKKKLVTEWHVDIAVQHLKSFTQLTAVS